MHRNGMRGYGCAAEDLRATRENKNLDTAVVSRDIVERDSRRYQSTLIPV
jgi:hypothetical protein